MSGELRESNDLIGSANELRSRFADDGYLFFRGLLDPAIVSSTRSDILRALAGLGWTAPGSVPEDGVPGDLIRREGDDNWWDGYLAINRVRSFHALAHERAILRVQHALFGREDLLVHPRKICRVTYPNSDHPTPAHQDFPLLQGTIDCVSVWVPLGDVQADLGGLRVLTGSAREGMQEVVGRGGVGGIGVAADDDDPRWATAEYRTGDVLMFHVLTVHWAPPNRGDRLRLSADYRYQPADDPIATGSLLPHYFGQIPGWDELTTGWESTWPVEAPAGVVGVDVIDPRTIEAPPSKLLMTATP